MIYSPSSRDEYSFCPRSWWLRKNGWKTRSIGYPELCAIGGQAVSLAMEHWNQEKIIPIPGAVFPLTGWGDLAVYDVGNQLVYGRRVSPGKAVEFLEQLPLLVDQAVKLLVEKDPLKGYQILEAETEFPEAGNARFDILAQQRDGRKVVFDYKVKFSEMKDIYLAKTFEQYRNGEQRLTYTSLTKTDMFGIILVLMNPTKNGRKLEPRIEVQTWPVFEREQRTWYREASLLSSEMDRILSIPRADLVRGKSYPHENQYGPCPYQDACLRHDLDIEKMKLDYIQIEKEVV